MAIIPAVMSAMGIPFIALGILVIAICSRILENIINAMA